MVSNEIETKEPSLPGKNSLLNLSYENKLTKKQILKLPPAKIVSAIDHTSECNFSEFKTNNLIFGDNLSVLSKMISDGLKVDLIYLDPPYNTGGAFQSRELEFSYSDDMSTVEHVEFMRRRLILMHELLSDEGSLYLHIGHQMLFHMKVILDEIFGEQRFKNLITRRKCSSKNSTRNQYPNLNDFILFYTKSKRYTWNRPGVTPSKEWLKKEYPFLDEKGAYKLVPVHAPGIRHGETGKPWRGKLPPKGKHWQLTPEKLDELDRSGELHWSKNGNPRRKVRLVDNKQLPLTDYWNDYRDAHHQSISITGYPTEKNSKMLEVIINASSNPGDLVLDPFCGSGSTLEAAHKNNRHWIGIDTSEVAIKTCLSRFKNGSHQMGDYVSDTTSTQPQETLPFPKNEPNKYGHEPNISSKDFELLFEKQYSDLYINFD